MKELKNQEKDLDQIIKAIERDIEYDFWLHINIVVIKGIKEDKNNSFQSSGLIIWILIENVKK